VNVKDYKGRTPLWSAKENDHIEIVELLRKHGAKE
jgi:ankyrin repeat protein